jgi:quaternary ammonium compound-resistance protein SugE
MTTVYKSGHTREKVLWLFPPLLRTFFDPINFFKGNIMPWLILSIAGIFEVAWAVGLKYTVGFTRPLPTALTVIAMIASMWLLSIAMRHIPVGTAYSVWVGIGAVGTVIGGSILFGEVLNPARVGSILLIIAGIIGLKFSSGV